MMDILCVDVGNTTTHLGLVREDRVIKSWKVDTGRIFDGQAEGLRAVLEEAKGHCTQLAGLSYCSVVPNVNERLNAAFEQILPGTPVFHLTWEHCPGIRINYPAPAEIGEDRLANAVGAKALYGAPVVVIDMGTAVTFDVVSSQGYEGGIITPGLEIMVRYLHEQTALLPELDKRDLLVSKGIGKSTVEAMKLGCSVGFDGMIRTLLERVLQELGKTEQAPIKVLGTGGSLGMLQSTWLETIEFHPDLTLLGLANAFKEEKLRLNSKG